MPHKDLPQDPKPGEEESSTAAETRPDEKPQPGYEWKWDGSQWVQVPKFSLGGEGGKGDKGGGGGGGGGGAAPDPNVGILTQVYIRLWGQAPPSGYVEGFAGELNAFEFELRERQKAAFRKTKTYKDESMRYAAALRQELSA